MTEPTRGCGGRRSQLPNHKHTTEVDDTSQKEESDVDCLILLWFSLLVIICYCYHWYGGLFDPNEPVIH